MLQAGGVAVPGHPQQVAGGAGGRDQAVLEGGQHQGEDHLGQEGQQGGPARYLHIYTISTIYLQVRLQLLLFTDLLLVCKKKR